MRIRKQAKLAGIPISNVSSHLPAPIGIKCQLNQSPWHCFDSPLSSYQIGGGGDYTLDVSFWDAVEPVESFPTMKISVNGDGAFLNNCVKKAAITSQKLCAKTDGKSWKCKAKVTEGHTLCQHHLDQLKGYNATTHASVSENEKSFTTVSSIRRKKRVSPSSDPYYYYAGFGRHSGKQRGGKDERNEKNEYKDKLDYIEDSDSDGDEDLSGEVRKKRARKPIKERSLKSLM